MPFFAPRSAVELPRNAALSPLFLALLALLASCAGAPATAPPVPHTAQAAVRPWPAPFGYGCNLGYYGPAWPDERLAAAVAAAGGTLRFSSVVGRAQLWIDGLKSATKDAAVPAPLVATLAPGGPRDVVLIVEADPGQPGGIAGRVVVTGR